MALSLLGPLQVDGAAPLSPRDRVVLSALVVRGGRVISAEQLADALWGEQPPASWSKVVQGCVARLRRVLGHDAVQTVPGGYRLALADDEIDVRRFESLVARGRVLAQAGEPDRAAAVLDSALALWRGTPLPDLDGWPDGRTEAGRLDELRAGAEEQLLAQRAAAGHDVVADATALVAAQPLREARWHVLAVALYRAGRQSDALAALRRARQTLRDELGLDPGRELADLERSILDHDPDLQPAARTPRPPAMDVCPYKGLVVYEQADAEAFFGRDQEVARCLRDLRSTPLLVVTGPSGSGKSSLVRAGLVPALVQAGQHVTLMTPGPEPMGALTTAAVRGGRGSVLVVDQLEELFAAGDETTAAFLDRLSGLAAAGTRVVLVLRADQLGALARRAGLARLVEQGLHLVTPMGPDELRAAVEGPAARAGLRLEPGLVELLLREVEGEPGALPLLSHALAETWVRREGSVLTVAGYQATGGIQGAVAKTAEQLWQSAHATQRAAIRALLVRLVLPGAGGAPVATRLPVGSVPADRRQALELLTACRLLVTDETTVTVAHEAVLRAWPRLRSWLDEDAAGRHTLRHLTVAAEDWLARGRPESELYRGARLAAAVTWRDDTGPDLTPVEHEFLDASLALARSQEEETRHHARQQARQNRRLRTALMGTAAALVLALVAGSVAVTQRQVAASRARDARIDGLVAQSAALRSTQRDLAALLAVTAFRLRPDPVTRGALLGVLTGLAGFAGYRHLSLPAGKPADAVMTPSGGLLLSTTRGALVEVDRGTGAVRRTLSRGEPDLADSRVAVSGDGSAAAVIAWEGAESRGAGGGLLSVHHLTGAQTAPSTVRLPLDPGAVAVSPDGSHVAVAGYDGGRVLIFDTRSPGGLPELLNVDADAPGVVQPEALPPGPLDGTTDRNTAAVAFLPDGLLLAGSERGTLRTVDPASGRVLHRWTGGPAWSTSDLLVLSPDGAVLVSAGPESVVRWDPDTRRPAWVTDVPAGSCRAMTLDPERGMVLCGGRLGHVTELDLDTGTVGARRYDMQRGALAAVLVSPGGERVVEISRTESVLATWDVAGLGPGRRVLADGAEQLSIDASGDQLLVAGPATYVSPVGWPRPVSRVVDASTGRPLARLGPHQVQPVWTGTPGRAAAWGEFGQGYLVDPRTGRRTLRLNGGFGEPALGGAASPDGRWLLAWGTEAGDTLRAWKVWDLRTGEPTWAGRAGFGSLGSLTPDGRTMLWSGGDSTVAYDVRTGRRVAERGGVHLAKVSPRGDLVASLEDGRLVMLRRSDLRTQELLLPGRPGVMEQLEFSADGRLLAARGSDGQVRLVDVPARAQLGEPVSVTRGVLQTVALHPRGRSLVLGGPQQVVRWDLRSAQWRRAACRLAGRSLTRDEWATHVGDLATYRPSCPA